VTDDGSCWAFLTYPEKGARVYSILRLHIRRVAALTGDAAANEAAISQQRCSHAIPVVGGGATWWWRNPNRRGGLGSWEGGFSRSAGMTLTLRAPWPMAYGGSP